jgi:hypothetical protein
VGQVKCEFTVPSRWVLVKGWKGDVQISKATVTFKSPTRVEIDWDGGPENHYNGSWVSRSYSLDHHSGMPVISRKCHVQMVANHLELSMSDDPSDSRIDTGVPRGTLHLVLKRVP